MKKYFSLQCKRFARTFPVAILTLLVLLGSLLGILGLVLANRQKDADDKLPIGVVGSTEDPLLQMGLSALVYFDDTRFSMELLPMEEAEATRALSRGDLVAYVVIPPAFMEEIYHGNILPLKFVTNVGASNLVTIFQTEITDTISRILLDAQKGVYGMYDAATENGQFIKDQMEDMPLKYTLYVLDREHTYEVVDLGISDGLGFTEYLLCGFCVVFLFLSCLPYAPTLIRKDTALARMLSARGRPAFLQTLCTFGAYLCCMTATVLIVFTLGLLTMPQKALTLLPLLPRMIPVVLLVSAFSYMLYCLATDLIGGILLQFFATLGLCFVSGCLYPAYFFPAKVQQLASYLPTGVARSQIAGAFTGEGSIWAVLLLIAYSAAFFLIGSLMTCRRVKEVE